MKADISAEIDDSEAQPLSGLAIIFRPEPNLINLFIRNACDAEIERLAVIAKEI